MTTFSTPELAPERRALLVGVGAFPAAPIDAPGAPDDRPAFDNLPFAYERVNRVAERLDKLHHYTTRTVLDPDVDALYRAVADCLAAQGVDCRIVHVLSHGVRHRTDPDRIDVVPTCGTIGRSTMDVRGWISDAEVDRLPPTLFLVDLCRAGIAATLSWQHRVRPGDQRAYIIAAAWRDEAAYEGCFSEAVAEVLEECRRTGLNTDATRRYVPLAAFARRVGETVARKSGGVQTVTYSRLDGDPSGAELPFLTNPNSLSYNPLGAERRSVDESVRVFVDDEVAGADFFPDRVGRHFSGRAAELARLVPWLEGRAEQHIGLAVVIGSPGAGKSALLGALVCAAHPELAGLDSLADLRDRLGSHCPAVAPAMAAVHARQRRLTEIVMSIAAQLGRQLGAGRPLVRPDRAYAPVTALVEAVRALAEPPVVVLDALDEAAEPDDVQAVLIHQLAAATRPDRRAACRMLVGMRPWPEFAPLRELAESTDGLVDLDRIPADRLRADLAAYLSDLLSDVDAYAIGVEARRIRSRLADGVASRLADRDRSDRETGPFLLAAVYAKYLLGCAAARDVNEAEAFASRVPRTLPAALELELTGHERADTLRGALAGVAQARGQGAPADLVGIFAQAAASVQLPEDELQSLLDRDVRFYLRTSAEQGNGEAVRLYRLFHQGLIEYLCEHPVRPAPTDMR